MVDKNRFEKLMEPCQIGPVKTRNRIVKTGAGLFMWHEDELHMNQAMLAFYESLARGGVGLLIMESPTVDYPRGARWRPRYRIDDDKYIKGLSELAQVIRKHNCPTFMQFNHDGPWQARLSIDPDPPYTGQPVAASAVTLKSTNDFHNEVPHVLTIEEIEEITDKFASAAVRAEKAGFQGIDINAASSHLLHNFLSPFWNRRNDEYGGNLENRARFVVNIIKEIKKRLGQDFPVMVCINGIEIGRVMGIEDEKCLRAEDSRATAKMLERAGADAIHVRSHWLGYHVGAYLNEALFYPEPPIPLNEIPREYDKSRRGPGANTLLSEGIKKVVSVPVMVVGRLDPELGEQVLREGKADLIGMTRRLLADPELPNKVAAGRLDDIAPCTACDNCLGSRRCRINALMGTDRNTIEKAEKKKKVAVVGGGPAGMEAARVAALRGHEVTLYDKAPKLGGLLPVAALVKGNHPENLPLIVQYLKRQMKKLGVNIKLGKEFSNATADKTRPDVVILATGGVPALPEIPGIDKGNVVSNADLHRRLRFFMRFLSPDTLRNLTNLYMPVGEKVVVIGNGIQGCELAEFLTKRGRKVTIVDTSDNPGAGMVDALMGYLFIWFEKKGVPIISGVKSIKVTDKGVDIVTKEGEKQSIEADTVIPALPLEPNTGLLKDLQGKVPEVYAIGDCNNPNLIADAIADGSRVARDL